MSFPGVTEMVSAFSVFKHRAPAARFAQPLVAFLPKTPAAGCDVRKHPLLPPSYSRMLQVAPVATVTMTMYQSKSVKNMMGEGVGRQSHVVSERDATDANRYQQGGGGDGTVALFAPAWKKRPRPVEDIQDPLALGPSQSRCPGEDRKLAGWDPNLLGVQRDSGPSAGGLFAAGSTAAADATLETEGREESVSAEKYHEVFREVVIRPAGLPAGYSFTERRFLLVHDVPLPALAIQEHYQQFAEGSCHILRASAADVAAHMPEAIKPSRKTWVTYAFAEWVNRRIERSPTCGAICPASTPTCWDREPVETPLLLGIRSIWI